MDWDPDAIPDQALGEFQEEFRPTPGTATAGFILMFLSASAAVVLACVSFWLAFGDVPPPQKPKALELPNRVAALLVLAAAASLGSLAVVFWIKARESWNTQVQVFEHGLRHYFKGQWQTVFWTNITLIRETQTFQRPPILHFPASLVLPKMKSSAFVLTLYDGRQLGFDGDTVNRIGRLGKRLKDMTAKCSTIVWEIETVQVGE